MPGVALGMSLDQLAAFLNARAGQMTLLDARPIFQRVEVLLTAAARDRFDQGRAPSGARWKPLKRPSKRRGGPTAKPLRDTGFLMASVTARGRGHVSRPSLHSLVWGTAVDYAGYQQDGTHVIPARPFLGWDDQLQERVEQIVAEQITEQLL